MCPFLWKDKIFVFFILTLRWHFRVYSFSLLRHSCKPDSEADRSTKSSAYMRQFNFSEPRQTGSQELLKIFGMLFIRILKSLGLRLHPCLTPRWVWKVGVKLLSILRHMLVLSYISFNNFIIFKFRPYLMSW